MIVFGAAVTAPEIYDRFAMPGIRQAAEPDSIVLAHGTAGSLFRNYNVLLDQAGAHEDLEALVLIHQDCELVDSDFVARVREVLSDPEVAIVGCVGAVGVRSIAWWQGAVTWAAVTHRYEEWGGGEFPGPTWHPEKISTHTAPGEVDSIDGFVMVLSPWAVRNLRFDESLGDLHGYDFDICMQAKAAGKKVIAADFRAIHHHSLELISDPEAWIAAYIQLVEKWDGLLPDTGASPERRALRGEAEAACARALKATHQYRATAIKRALDRANHALQKAREQLGVATRELDTANENLSKSSDELARTKSTLDEVLTSRSWRLTAPLRALRRFSRSRRA